MPSEEFLNFLEAIIAGIFVAIILLPMTSDTIRGRIFGAKKRAIEEAKQELMQVTYGMFLSNQQIDDFTYGKLKESISIKYKVKMELLCSKDEIISSLLHMINTTEALPGDIKRHLSNRAKKEYSDYDVCTESTSAGDFDTEVPFPKEVLQTWQEYIDNSDNFSCNSNGTFAKSLSWLCSLLGGVAVFLVLFSLQDYFAKTFILVVPCLFLFFLCTSILVSLVSKSQKDVEFFRQLVYKIVLLMILAVFEIVIIAFI